MKWWNKPLRISAVQCNYGEDSLAVLKDHVKGGNFNTEQLLHLIAEGHMGFYEEEKHGALLDRYLVESRKNAIREIVYLNVHCIARRLRDENPSWLQLDRERKPIRAYDVHYLTCVNNEWFRYYEKNLRLLCAHDIDGIFLDGPVFSPEGCYCPSCAEKFAQRYGKSIDSASYNELLEFKVDSVTEFIRKTNRIVKNINPDILLYLNNSALRADVTGSNTRKVEPYVDMLGAEGGFVWVDRELSLWHAGSMAKYLETQAKGKPTVIFFAGDSKPYSYYMHTAAETKILYAQSIANGANIWYGIHAPVEVMDCPGGRAARECNRLFAENEKYYRRTRPISKVALMWSMDSANYYSSSVERSDFTLSRSVGNVEKRGDHYRSFMGFYESLSRSHIQFDVVDEISAQDGSISRYELLILPTCGCMSRATAESIRRFVAAGGRLISSFDTGFFDGMGNQAESPMLADVMGIRAVGGIVKYPSAGTGYQRVQDAEWLGRGLSATLLPSAEYAVKCTPEPGVKVLASHLAPMASRYVRLPDKTFPGILLNTYGKGRSLYFGGTIGESYNKINNPDFHRLIENAVNGFSAPLVTTDAPQSVDIVLRKQPEESRRLLHVINMTGEMTRPIEKVIPLHDIHISMRISEPVKRVTDVFAGQDIPFRLEESALELKVSLLEDYKLFAIE